MDSAGGQAGGPAAAAGGGEPAAAPAPGAPPALAGNRSLRAARRRNTARLSGSLELRASLEGAPGLGLGAGSPFGLLFTPGSAPPARASWSGGPARLRHSFHAPPGFATPARPGRGRREEAGACGEAEAQPDRRLHAGLDAVVDKLRGRLSRCGPPARPEGRWGVVRSLRSPSAPRPAPGATDRPRRRPSDDDVAPPRSVGGELEAAQRWGRAQYGRVFPSVEQLLAHVDRDLARFRDERALLENKLVAALEARGEPPRAPGPGPPAAAAEVAAARRPFSVSPFEGLLQSTKARVLQEELEAKAAQVARLQDRCDRQAAQLAAVEGGAAGDGRARELADELEGQARAAVALQARLAASEEARLQEREAAAAAAERLRTAAEDLRNAAAARDHYVAVAERREAELQALRAEAAAEAPRAAELAAANEALQRRVAHLTCSLEKSKHRSTESQTEMAEKHRALIDELDGLRREAETQTENLQVQLETVTAELAQRNEAVIAVRSDVEASQVAMKTVTQQLEAAFRTEATALRGQLEQKEETAEEARRLIGELREQIQHLSEGLQARQEELAGLKRSLQGQLAEKEDHIQKLTCDMEKLEAASFEEVVAHAASAEQKTRRLEADLAEAQAKGQKLRRALEASEQRWAAAAAQQREAATQTHETSESYKAEIERLVDANAALQQAAKAEAKTQAEAKAKALPTPGPGSMPPEAVETLRQIAEHLHEGLLEQAELNGRQIRALEAELEGGAVGPGAAALGPELVRAVAAEVDGLNAAGRAKLAFLRAFLAAEVASDLLPRVSLQDAGFALQLVQGAHLAEVSRSEGSRAAAPSPSASLTSSPSPNLLAAPPRRRGVRWRRRRRTLCPGRPRALAPPLQQPRLRGAGPRGPRRAARRAGGGGALLRPLPVRARRG